MELLDSTMKLGLSNPLSAAAFALLGAGVLRIVDKFLSRDKEGLNTSMALRKELRDEVNTLTEQIKYLTQDLDQWKLKYWEQVELIAQLRSDNIILQSKVDELLRICYEIDDTSGEHKIKPKIIDDIKDRT